MTSDPNLRKFRLVKMFLQFEELEKMKWSTFIIGVTGRDRLNFAQLDCTLEKMEADDMAERALYLFRMRATEDFNPQIETSKFLAALAEVLEVENT